MGWSRTEPRGHTSTGPRIASTMASEVLVLVRAPCSPRARPPAITNEPSIYNAVLTGRDLHVAHKVGRDGQVGSELLVARLSPAVLLGALVNEVVVVAAVLLACVSPTISSANAIQHLEMKCLLFHPPKCRKGARGMTHGLGGKTLLLGELLLERHLLLDGRGGRRLLGRGLLLRVRDVPVVLPSA